MTLFTTPMARQFVGFDTLFEELNRLADRKEPNYPAYNIARMMRSITGSSLRSPASEATTSASRPKRAC